MPRGDVVARRTALAVSVIAGMGVALTCALTAAGAYDARPVPPGGPHVYGPGNPPGSAGAVGRLIDSLSYFTVWSNIAVAVAFWKVARGRWGDEPARQRAAPVRRAAVAPDLRGRVALLTALLMITVTAVVYAVLLAPTDTVAGWSLLTNPWQHIAVPLAALGVWGVWGPRLGVTPGLVGRALVVPIAWLAYAFVRGAVIDAYPYGFLDPVSRGWSAVVVTVAGILVFALVVAALFGVADALLGRVGRRRTMAG